MTTVRSHAPGSFCWIELATTDVSAARAFYAQLFSVWEARKNPGVGVCVPPTDIAHVGRFAVLTDPQGAPFVMIKLG